MRDALILIDTAEKQPLTFPPVIRTWGPGGRPMSVVIHTKTEKLPTGDYLLASHPNEGVVERKNGPTELYQNLFTPDSVRFAKCLSRLSEYRSPCLYVEATQATLGRATKIPTKGQVLPPGKLLSRLLMVLADARMTLLTGTGSTASGKVAGGELVATFLIQAALAAELRGKSP